MPSLQFKILASFLKASRKYNKIKHPNEVHFGQAWEMPTPPKILRSREIDNYQLSSFNIFICQPEKITSQKIILYLHGGAYFTRIMLPHWLFVQKLANRFGMKVFLPDYPTAPAYNYSHTYDFVVDLYKDLLLNHKAEDIYFFGDSAGGGLALTLSQALKKLSLPQPSGLILLSPWLDVSMTNPEINAREKKDIVLSLKHLLITGKMYAGNTDLKNPIISPIYGDLTDLPDIHLFIGTHDILLPDCHKLKNLIHGSTTNLIYHEYDQMVHCWMLFPIPEAEAVIREIEKIIPTQ